ncbi:class II histone deacetylase [Streptomyces albipurpureus]|uniref:Class II histone deacetylase n=1 Tax=Streptomyces albipurpureus TaxID=2897419 RepID=A0ABT0UXC1_9ACTN|nr:class II histone deacetylase [Streptomyces sp. CWNU-1]MCM2393222.1 class II histone deacetylase [Streptomyces sp. CWNU-1]
MSTGYVWHERYAWHDTGAFAANSHAGGYLQPFPNFESPESKARLAGLIEVSGMLDQLLRVPARPATETDILRVHSRAHLERIKAASASGRGDAGDGRSPFGPGGYEIALLSAGGTIAATEAVLTGRAENAYALVRPPGHHAVRDHGMGFCVFANIAVAAEWARANHGIRRVAVVDYDVHHGNGTQDIFEDDTDVLTISIHQERLFPRDTGAMEDHGTAGTALNIPLPAGCGNDAYTEAVRRVVVPALHRFAPELIMVASGFDASAYDPLGRMSVTCAGYRSMTEQLVQAAREICSGRLVMSHEGGYSPVYTPFCGLAVLEALSGHDTGVGDPFDGTWANSPQHPLTPVQDTILGAAEGIAERLQLTVPREPRTN